MKTPVAVAPEATRASSGMPIFLWVIIGIVVLGILFVLLRRSANGGRIFFIPARLFLILLVAAIVLVVFLVFKPVRSKSPAMAVKPNTEILSSSSLEGSENLGGTDLPVSSSPESVPESSSEESPQDAFEPAAYIVGSWSSARREGDTIITSYYEFKADGTCEEGGVEYMPTAMYKELFPGATEDWEVAPMGFPYSFGTYTVKANTVTVTITGDSVDSISESFTYTLTVDPLESDRAVFTGSLGAHPFVKVSNVDLKELCSLVGVDMTPPIG